LQRGCFTGEPLYNNFAIQKGRISPVAKLGYTKPGFM
jgi:hypothetical protein